MNNIQIFNNPQFGEIRVIENRFCLNDVCKILNLSNITETKKRLNGKGLSTTELLTSGGLQSMLFIDEPNLYKCIFQSRKQEAEAFQDWVTSEVLPSIRKTGGYISTKEEDTPELIMARALQVAQDTLDRHRLQLEQANSVIKEQAPKVEYYDDVMNSKGLLTINTIANDLGMSAIKLNRILVEKKIQYRQNDTYVLYSQYRNLGLVQHIPHPYLDRNGQTKTTQHMYWTEKGKQFIYDVIKEAAAG